VPRYRKTNEGVAKLAGRLLLAIAKKKHTSSTLADELGVSHRQVNRYVLQLVEAGWQIERVGVPTHSDYWFELKAPRIVLTQKQKPKNGTR